MSTTIREHIERLLLWLMHAPPTPAEMDEMRRVITPEENGDAGVKWRTIRKALKVVEGPWDTALIIAAVLDERVSVQLQQTEVLNLPPTNLEALKLGVLLNPKERCIAEKVFEKSQLETLLVTDAGTQADIDIVSARHKFLKQFEDDLIEELLFPNRADLYNIARSMTKTVRHETWLPYKRDAEEANKGANKRDAEEANKGANDDYFGDAMLRLSENFRHLQPQNYTAFVVKVMSNQIISSLKPYTQLDYSR